MVLLIQFTKAKDEFRSTSISIVVERCSLRGNCFRLITSSSLHESARAKKSDKRKYL